MMTTHWNRLTVAALQVIALCSDELVGKCPSNSPERKTYSGGPTGYPLTRLMLQMVDYFDPIEDSEILARVDLYPDDATFLTIFGNGSLEIATKPYLLSCLRRELVGRLCLWSPLDDLSWVVVCNYENIDMDGEVPFRFVEARSGDVDRHRGLGRLLEIAEDGGIGQPLVTDHNL